MYYVVANFITSSFELASLLWLWKRGRLDHITVFSHFSGDELEIDFVTSKKTAFSFYSLVLKVKRELCRNIETMAFLYFGHNIILQNLVSKVRQAWLLVPSLPQATLTVQKKLHAPLSFSLSIDKVKSTKLSLNHQLIAACFHESSDYSYPVSFSNKCIRPLSNHFYSITIPKC